MTEIYRDEDRYAHLLDDDGRCVLCGLTIAEIAAQNAQDKE